MVAGPDWRGKENYFFFQSVFWTHRRLIFSTFRANYKIANFPCFSHIQEEIYSFWQHRSNYTEMSCVDETSNRRSPSSGVYFISERCIMTCSVNPFERSWWEPVRYQHCWYQPNVWSNIDYKTSWTALWECWFVATPCEVIYISIKIGQRGHWSEESWRICVGIDTIPCLWMRLPGVYHCLL